MRKSIWNIVAGAVLGLASAAQAQIIVAGPVRNPANDHRYRLITGASWVTAQSIARSLGGDLATIDDAAENDWVTATFTGGGRKFFIGLNDAASPGSFVWSDGSSSTYRNWDRNQPGTNADFVQLRSDKTWATATVQPDSLYLVEIAGPIRVPREYSDIDDAFAAMNTLQWFDLEVGNTLPMVDVAHTLTVPPGKTGRIRGVGREASRIRLWQPTAVLDLRGAWDISDVAFWRVDDDAYLRFSGGRVRMSDVYLTGFYDVGQRLVVLGAGASVEMRRCAVGRSRGGPVFTGEGPTTANVIAIDTWFSQAVAITNPSVTATLSSCTLYVCGVQSRGPIFNAAASLANTLVYRPNTSIGDNVTAEWCVFPYAVAGEGNIVGEATFEPGGFRPTSDSIVVNAGNAAVGWTSGLDNERGPRVADGKIDIGAYEYQPTRCSADFNNDGFITFEDFDDFVAAFQAGC